MRLRLGLIFILMLSGCATQSQMSAEQLRALAMDKNFSAVCSTIIGPYGTGRFVYVNVDRAVVANGAISVDANCLITMSNESNASVVGVRVIPRLKDDHIELITKP